MFVTALLMAGFLPGLLEARIVDVELVRSPSWYNKVTVELESPVGRTLHLCPGQASVSTARLIDDALKPVDRYPAHAMDLPGEGYAGTCRDLSLAPGEPRRITFIVRGVPGRWRAEDLYTFSLEAGERRFRFVEAGRTR